MKSSSLLLEIVEVKAFCVHVVLVETAHQTVKNHEFSVVRCFHNKMQAVLCEGPASKYVATSFFQLDGRQFENANG